MDTVTYYSFSHCFSSVCTANRNVILLLSSPPLIVLLSYGSITTGILPALLIYPTAVIATITPLSCVITVFNPVLLCLAYNYALACLSAPGTQPLIYHHSSRLHWKLTMLVNQLLLLQMFLCFLGFRISNYSSSFCRHTPRSGTCSLLH